MNNLQNYNQSTRMSTTRNTFKIERDVEVKQQSILDDDHMSMYIDSIVKIGALVLMIGITFVVIALIGRCAYELVSAIITTK